MLRKSAIALAAVALLTAGSTLGASARGGGGFGGMGHGGFGGMGHAGFARGVGFAPHAMGVGRFAGARPFAFRANRFAFGRPFVRNRFVFRHRPFFRNRFAFVGVPLYAGAYGYDSCYAPVWTPWGWRWRFVCY